MNIHKHTHINWALADQALVSAINFLTGIILARYLGLEEFGKYTLFFTVLIYTNYIQRAFIVAPMQIFVPQLKNEQNSYLYGLLAIQIYFGLAICILAYLMGSIFEPQLGSWDISRNILAFSVCIFLYLQQDMLRRSYFVLNKAKPAFTNDLISYGGQLVLIVILLLTGNLSVANAFLAIAISSGAASIYGIYKDRMLPRRSHTKRAFKRSWEHAKHLVIAWQLEWLSTHGILLIAGVVLGVSAAGAIRAAQNLVAPIYMMFQAMENFVPVDTSARVANYGIRNAATYLARAAVTGSAILAVVCIVISVNSEWLMAIVYGREFSKFSSLVAWQAAIIFIWYLYLLAQYFYRAIGDTAKVVRSSFVLSLVTIITVILLIDAYGVGGVMAGVFAGMATTVIYLAYGIYPKYRPAT